MILHVETVKLRGLRQKIAGSWPGLPLPPDRENRSKRHHVTFKVFFNLILLTTAELVSKLQLL